MRIEQAVGLALATIGAIKFITPASAQDPLPEVAAELRNAGFSEAQIRSVRSGGIATRILPQHDDNAAFVTGVVRVAAPAKALADGIRRIEVFRSGGRTLQIGRFRTPPALEDIQPLVLESRDLDDLRRCKLGDCSMKAGRQAIELIQSIDWNAADARERAASVFKSTLHAQVRAYLEKGSQALAEYNDNDRPASVASAFEQILRDSPGLVRSNPAFYRYVLEFPKEPPPPNVECLCYWSKEKLRKTVVTVVHVCLQRLESQGHTSYYIALKHIYDSHYFLAYGEFMTTHPERDPTKGFYLVRSIKALIDPPRGLFRGLLLGRIKRAMRDQLAADLQRTRSRLESIPGVPQARSGEPQMPAAWPTSQSPVQGRRHHRPRPQADSRPSQH